VSDIVRRIQEIELAKRECEPVVGMALDGIYGTPGAVYRDALKRLGHQTNGLRKFDDDTNVAQTIFRALPGRKAMPQRRMAADAATLKARAEMFPHGGRVRAAL
jgi:hypothetical protein